MFVPVPANRCWKKSAITFKVGEFDALITSGEMNEVNKKTIKICTIGWLYLIATQKYI